MSSAPVDVVGCDHLDLLVSAAVRYRVLAGPTAAAFSAAGESAGIVATPSDAGRLLLKQNRASARWKSVRARVEADMSDVETLHYEHRRVEDFEPIEVIKAAHGYQQRVADGPIWNGTAAQRLLDAIVYAAIQRLPGYAEAAWEWTRKTHRLGAPVGLRRHWVPVDRGV
jgi:hypothetical protein